MVTKLWLLGQTDANETGEGVHAKYIKESPWYPVYDCYHNFMIEAETEQQARELAADNAGDEGRDAWLNPHWSYCEEFKLDGKPGIWMSDFHAG